MINIHKSLEGMPFRVGFECAVATNGNTHNGEVSSIDYVAGVVCVVLYNGNRVFFKHSRATDRWMRCELNENLRWVFGGSSQLIW